MHGFIVAQLPNGKAFHFSVKQKGKANPETGHLYHLSHTGKLDTLCSLTMPSFRYESTLTTDAGGRWYLSTGGHEIFHGVNDSLGFKQAHPSVVIKLFCDSKNTLWIGTLNGLYYAPDGRYDQAQKVLEKSAVAVTAEDALGGLWAKSNAHCFIHIPNQGLYCYSQEEGALHNDRIQFIAFDASRVYALLTNGEIAVLERDTIRYIPLPHTANRLFRDTLNDRLYASTNKGPVSFWNSEAWQAVQGRELMRSGIIKYDLAHDSTLRVATKHEILRIAQGKLELVYKGRGRIGEISAFCTRPEGGIWIGGTKGLWLWDGKALTQPYTALENAEHLQSDIREVVHLRGKIIVETVRNGMFVVQGERITPLLDNHGEALRLTSITTTGATTLWGIPHNKWARIANIEFDDGGHHVSEYVYSDYVGFLGGVRQQLAIMGDRIYRGSSNGLYVTSRHTLKDIGPAPSTCISEVYVNHRR
ncbi:MAG: hypothetical protein AAGB22_11730, partial [Bacteroidota bacterium]